MRWRPYTGAVLCLAVCVGAGTTAHVAASAEERGDRPAAGVAVVALAEGNRLLRFPVDRPEDATVHPIAGADGELLGIDWRPADGRLYAVSDTNDLYTVDAERGEAKRVSTLTVGFEGTPGCGFDFNPQADRLRLVAASGQDLRVHVTLGAVATDGPLAYAAGDPNAGARPHVTAVAYTDNVPEAPETRLFDIDWKLDVLALQDPPNDGLLQTVGPLGVDFGPLGGFDILTGPDGSETAFAASGAVLYTIDLDSGAATERGRIGDGSVAPVGLTLVPLGPR